MDLVKCTLSWTDVEAPTGSQEEVEAAESLGEIRQASPLKLKMRRLLSHHHAAVSRLWLEYGVV